MRTTTTYQNDWQNYAQNFAATNSSAYSSSTFGMKLINDAIRHLVGTFFFNEASYTVPGGTVASQQAYQLPFNNKQVVDTTVLIGSVLWQPQEVATRKAFDALNVISFVNDFPQFYYIWNNQLLLWPTPASSANAITINYKKRLRDLSVADYTTGTLSATNASVTVTGSGTSWTTNMAGRWLNIPITASNTTSGDDEWYQISSVESATSLTLLNAYAGGTVTGGNYTIGEVPILPEDYQDLPLYRALYIYFSTYAKNPTAATEFKDLYTLGYAQLDAEFGSKTASVGITPANMSVQNPNLFQSAISHA